MTQRCISLRHAGVWAAVIVIALAASALVARAQANFSSPKNISNTPSNSMSQQIAVDSRGNIDVVWTDNTPGNYVLLFSRSHDGGSTFSTPLNISNNATGTVETPHIATDQTGNIYVAWEYYVSSASGLSEFSRSLDGGATFSAPVAINGGTGGSAPRIAVDPIDAIDLAWSDNSLGYPSVFFRCSVDQGATFSTPVNVSNNPLGAGGPYMSLDPTGNIYLAWTGNATFNGQSTAYVYFSDAPEAGMPFSPPVQISSYQGPNTFLGTIEVAATSASNIDVVWSQQNSNGSGSLLSANSTNGGTTFTFNLDTGSGEYAPLQQVAVDPAGGVDIVWQTSGGDGSANVTFGRTTGGPMTVTGAATIGWNTPNPQIAVDVQGKINVTFYGYQTQSGAAGIQYTQSTNSGASFSPVQSISTDSGSLPQIAVDTAGNSYLAWQASENAGDIFFSTNFSAGLSGVSVNPASVTGGGSSSGTVTLSVPAPAGGAEVSLMGNNAAASVPASVTVPAGSTSETFGISTAPVAASTAVTISASFSGVTQSASLTVLPPALTSVTLLPASVTGGQSSTGTGLLSGAAPSSGVAVTLSSSVTSVATVPPSITVAAGAASATFNVSTSIVTSSTQVTITGSAGGASSSATLTVNAASGAPSFNVVASPTALIVMAPGQSAATTLTFSSKGGFAGTGALTSSTCGAAASMGITCSLTAFNLPANGTATATLTFMTTAPSAGAAGENARYILLTLLLGLGVVYLLVTRRGEQRRWDFAFAAVLFAVLITGTGCGTATTGAMSSNTGNSGGAGDPPSNSGTPLGAVSSVSVPVVINGTTQTVPGLTLTIQ